MKEVPTRSTQVRFNILNSDVQLLLRCFSTYLQVESDAFIRLDFADFLNMLECHRLTCQFYITAKNKGFLTMQDKNLLEESFIKKKLRMLSLGVELCKIIRQFNQANIDAVALKGPLLAQRYYSDHTARECNDLDILVKPNDVQGACGLLLEMGYELTEVLWNGPRQKSLYHKTFHHYNMYNANADVMIELHWRLYSSCQVDEGATENIWRNLSFQKLGGLNIHVLSKLDTFIYLSVHGSAHRWKRLFWVQDIVRIIEKEGGDFVGKAYQKAVGRGVARQVLEGCHLSHILFDACLPLVVQQAIQSDRRIAHLAAMSILEMNHVTASNMNPVASWGNLMLAIKRTVNYYRTIYHLEGGKALTSSFKRFFINPRYWRTYCFDDRFFVLNYIAAPFLWAYSLFDKNSE